MQTHTEAHIHTPFTTPTRMQERGETMPVYSASSTLLAGGAAALLKHYLLSYLSSFPLANLYLFERPVSSQPF